MVWDGIGYGGSSDIYVTRNGYVTDLRYRDEILAPKTFFWCNCK